MLKFHREQDQVQLYKCRADASADFVFHASCFENYIKDIRNSNQKMKDLFAAEYKEYM